MVRNFWFQLHWLIGITAGLVLAVVGVTGALLSFEDDILRAINPGVLTVTPTESPHLSPDMLLARIREAAPAREINWIGLSADPADAAQVNFADGGRRGTTVQVHPATGELLGQPRGRAFFLDVMRLHRWLLVGDTGKQIVGASTLLLIVLCLSGLYLRWPRRVLDWRTWLTFDFRRKGRSFLWDLHSVLGTWALLFYLLAAVTGLYWSYEWYRDGLYAISGVERPVRGGPPAADAAPAPESAGPLRLDDSWRVFEATIAGYSSVRLQLPRAPDAPVTFRYLDADPAHERASNTLNIDPQSGVVLDHARYDDKPLNEKLMGSMLPLHSGSFFGLGGLILMMIASLGMPLFAITGWMLYLDRRRKKAARRAAARTVGRATAAGGEPVLVAYASQSGTAERYAWLSAGTLQAAGVPVTVKPLGRLGPEDLMGFRQAFFALATFGDGEAPDDARAFARRMAGARPVLANLRYGLLALGDRAYDRYCGFGHSVGEWLRTHGAQPLFEPVEVDDGDAGALALWQRRLADQLGASPGAVWEETAFQPWRVAVRRQLNAGSPGGPVFHLELVPPEGTSTAWQAGDIAEIRAGAGPDAAVREYSIASIPEEGRIHLLVRQVRKADGTLGVGSGWLTEGAPEGGEVALRIRRNPGFHGPDDERPLILIGNGTGMAGLRSHLRAQARAGRRGHWLLFGERQRTYDFHYGDEVAAWRDAGVLARVDPVFSRDQAERIYVQHKLAAAADDLRDWVARGAAIYVCGSQEGMAPAVDAVLVETLGADRLERLAAEGRYRRDVY